VSNDLHRTGCGCEQCGPPRIDPLEGDFPDPELMRARKKLTRIQGIVERVFTSDPYNTAAALQQIREELAA
jgi:hypothetical protein